MPLAEAAAKALQTAEILDTLGAVYLMNGRNQEAVNTLTRARELARDAQMAVTTSVHLADALHANGDSERAKAVLGEASTIVEMNPGMVSDRTKTDLQDVRKKITPP